MPKLANKRQEMFARFKASGLTGAAAAREARYSSHSAHVQASILLSKPNIAARVSELEQERWAALQMSEDELRARIAATARFDPRKLVDAEGQPIPLHQLDDETAWALAGIDMEERSVRDEDGDEKSVISVRTKKYRAADKNKAQEMLARMANLFKQDNSSAADAAIDAFAQVLGGVIGGRSGIGGLVVTEAEALPGTSSTPASPG